MLHSLCSALFEVEFICCVLVVAGTICFTLAENKQFVQRSLVDEHAHELLNTLHVPRPAYQLQMEHLHENNVKFKNKEEMEIVNLESQLEKLEQNKQIKYVTPETTIEVVKNDKSTQVVHKSVIKEKNIEAVNKISNISNINNSTITVNNTFANFSDHNKTMRKEDDKETCLMFNVTSKRVIKKTPLDDVEVVAIEESHRDETNNNNNNNNKIEKTGDKESSKECTEKAEKEKGKDNKNTENKKNENIIETKCTHKTEQSDDAPKEDSKSKPDENEQHPLRKNEEEKEKEKETNNNSNNNNSEDNTKTNNKEKDNEETKDIQHHEPQKRLKSNQSTSLFLSFVFTTLKFNTVLAVGCVVLSNVLDSIMYAVEEKYCLLGTSQEEEQQSGVNFNNVSKPFTSEDAEKVKFDYPTLETENTKDYQEKEQEELLWDEKDVRNEYDSSEGAKEVLPSSSSSSSSSSSLIILNTLMFYMNCFAALIYGSIWVVYSLYSYFNKNYMYNANQMNSSKSNFHDYTKLWMYASCAALASNIGTTALLAIIAEESSTTAVLITVIRKTLTVLLSFCQYDSHHAMNDTHHKLKNYTIGVVGLWSVQFTVFNGFTREHGFGLLLLMFGLTAYEYVRRNKNKKKKK